MIFLIIFSIITGNLSQLTKQGILIENEKGFHPFLIKSHTVFINFSQIDELEINDRVKIEYFLKEGVPIALKIEKDKKFFINPVYEAKEIFIKNSLQNYQVIDIREKKEYLHFHLPFAMMEIKKKDKPVLIYGNNSQDERVIEYFLKLQKEGFKEIFVYLDGALDWNKKGNYFYTEPEAVLNYSKNFILIDVRSKEERQKGVVDFAYFKEIEKMNWEEFSSKAGMVPIVFYGEDENDERPKIAAERVLKWRFENTKNGEVSILRGGIKELQRKGFKIKKIEIKEFRKEFLKKEGEITLGEIQNFNEYFLVDLRDEESQKANLQFSLNKLDEYLKDLPKNKKIIFFCYEGKRSRIAYEILKNLNFNVKYICEEINF